MTNIKTAEAAGRVGSYLWAHRGETRTLEDIAAGTRLTVPQIKAAERALKTLVAKQADQFQGYVLHIAIGPSGEHGFLQVTAKTVRDQISRARYMLHRLESELDMTAQSAERLLDDETSRRLSRALRAYSGASALFEDVLEVTESALQVS